MQVQRGLGNATELVVVGAEVLDRVELATSPDHAAVQDYVMTRSAERAWSRVNQQLAEEQGSFSWIGGPAGAGKTHFLNYILALNDRAGALGASNGRRLTIAIAVAAATRANELERELAGRIARAVAGGSEAAAVWRNLRGADVIRVALDQAKRRGVAAITLALDFGELESKEAEPRLEALAELARTVAHPQLIVVAAGRAGLSFSGADTYAVAAAADELAATAISRARRFEPAATDAIAAAYDGIDLGDLEAERIYPFHPAAANALAALGGDDALVAPIARMAQAAINEWRNAVPPRGLIWPADLTETEEIRARLSARLGENGRAAGEIARAAARAIAQTRRALAEESVEVLILHHVTGERTPLPAVELGSRLGRYAVRDKVEPLTNEEIESALAELAARSRGVIQHDPATGTARFIESAAGAPEVAAFNAALSLMRRFDATLGQVAEMEELRAAEEQLRVALAGALENAARNRELLTRAVRMTGGALTAEQEQALADFIAVVERGPSALIAAAADVAQKARLERTIRDYDALATLAAAAPRLRAMREYLEAMGFHRTIEDDPNRDPPLAKLETECKLLLVAVEAAMQAKATGGLDALESRFQRFKWTYVPFYRVAHEGWRQEMEATAALADDGRRVLAALKRLNAINALGPPVESGLEAQFEDAARAVARCALDGPLAPEIMPCCPHCAYVLGTPSPRAVLNELIVRARRALEAKFAILSQSTIARLIQEHDHNHRLEGFLKITQAAQTDALITVLDDKLARYLARLLDENLAADATGPALARVVRPLRATRSGLRGQRRGKAPPNDRM